VSGLAEVANLARVASSIGFIVAWGRHAADSRRGA
jgi:hypothetical protein